MDLKEIKSRLNSLQTKSSPTGGKRNIFWRPEVGKQVVRVVPNKFNKSNPFTEAFFYYGIGQRVMISPTNLNASVCIPSIISPYAVSLPRTNVSPILSPLILLGSSFLSITKLAFNSSMLISTEFIKLTRCAFK